MTTNLPQLLGSGRLRTLPTTASEIAGLFRVVERDLVDARLEALSEDRRFATAYNAALQLATIVLRSEGYRTHGAAHHHTTIVALPLIMGPGMAGIADYLDACRARRNTVDYDGVGIATDADVEELIEAAEELARAVRSWLAAYHPEVR